MGRISEHSIQKVAEATDIVDLIGARVPLKRAGASFRGLCPFHKEKSPSFHVSPQKQSYHCFGCGAGGSVFQFLMEYEGMDFLSAVRLLADKAGIRLEEDVGGNDGVRDQKKILLRIHEMAAEWFHQNLLRTAEGQVALEYLNKRGLGGETIRAWQLGYAPAGWDALLTWAKTQRIPEPQLIQAGLVRQRQENDPSAGCYDRFRNRVIFPICNDQGSPIAFSGRALTDEPNQPKYLNSPETPLFTKSRVLFGLNRSKRAMLDQDRALLLEGQVDLITCHQFGFENAVAPQGTAFTSDQAKILRRYVAEVVLCFDSDHAGQEAALKAIPLLLQANLSAKVMRLPAGEDPDSLLRTHGAEPFAKLQAEAVEFPEFLVQHYRETLDLESGRDKMRFVEKVSPILQLVSNAVLKEMAIARWSEALSLPASVFRTPTKAGKVDNQAPRASTSTSVDRTPRAFVRPDGCIHRLTFLAYRSSDARQWLREREVYQVLQNEPGAKILESILLSEIQGDDPASLDALAGEMPVSGAGRYLSELRQAPLPKEVIDAVAHSNEGLQIKIRLQAAEARVTDALQETVPNHQRIAAARQELLDLRRQHKHFGGA